MIRKKNTRTVVIVPVASVFLAVIPFLAVNGPADGAEGPHRTPLTVQFLLSLFAQFVFRDKSGHDHHPLFQWREGIVSWAARHCKRLLSFD